MNFASFYATAPGMPASLSAWGLGYSPEGEPVALGRSAVPGRYLDVALGVPGLAPPALGLRAFDQGPTVVLPGNARPTGWAPVSPDIAYREEIDTGARGTTQTLARMREMAITSSQDPGFVQRVRRVVADCPSKDRVCEAATILDYVRRNVAFRDDPAFMEYLQSPAWTWFVEKQGDCDDQATLIAAMDVSIGRPCRFRAYMLDSNRPREYSHVACQAWVPGQGWLSQDSVVAGYSLGQEPPRDAWIGPPNDLVVLSP